MSEDWTLEAGKRLAVQRSDFLRDWFVSYSPRNCSEYAEGPWEHWVDLAVKILQDPLTAITRPEAHELSKQLEVMDYYSDANRYLTDEELIERFGEESE
ncbi:hypothetical protein RGQ21_67720 [Kitasatospora aureofaciens]|nr:hypothetical protein RGQ21_67720 [Kitasatospora aureofaciens]